MKHFCTERKAPCKNSIKVYSHGGREEKRKTRDEELMGEIAPSKLLFDPQRHVKFMTVKYFNVEQGKFSETRNQENIGTKCVVTPGNKNQGNTENGAFSNQIPGSTNVNELPGNRSDQEVSESNQSGQEESDEEDSDQDQSNKDDNYQDENNQVKLPKIFETTRLQDLPGNRPESGEEFNQFPGDKSQGNIESAPLSNQIPGSTNVNELPGNRSDMEVYENYQSFDKDLKSYGEESDKDETVGEKSDQELIEDGIVVQLPDTFETTRLQDLPGNRLKSDKESDKEQFPGDQSQGNIGSSPLSDRIPGDMNELPGNLPDDESFVKESSNQSHETESLSDIKIPSSMSLDNLPGNQPFDKSFNEEIPGHEIQGSEIDSPANVVLGGRNENDLPGNRMESGVNDLSDGYYDEKLSDGSLSEIEIPRSADPNKLPFDQPDQSDGSHQEENENQDANYQDANNQEKSNRVVLPDIFETTRLQDLPGNRPEFSEEFERLAAIKREKVRLHMAKMLRRLEMYQKEFENQELQDNQGNQDLEGQELQEGHALDEQ